MRAPSPALPIADPDRPWLGRVLRMPGGRPFLRLWSALSISVVGDQVTAVAVPTLAILALGAGPFEVGLLSAGTWIAWPVLGPIAGVWVDRLPRRPVLVACDLARMTLLLSIPIAGALGVLGFPQLLAVVAAAGIANVFFDLAFTAHVPEVVERRDIPVANTRLEASRSGSYVAGPSLAGALIGLVGAPLAVVLDAASFLASAVLIRSSGPTRFRRGVASAPRSAASAASAASAVAAVAVGSSDARSLRRDLAEGLDVLRRQPVLLRLVVAAALSNFGLVAARALLLLHLYRDLGFTPALAGLVLAAPGVGALAGVGLAGWIGRRVGVGRALLLATVLESAVWLVIPVATGPLAAIVVAVALAASSVWGLVWNVLAQSVRQVAVDSSIQGRVAAIRGAIGFGVIPLGGLAGGAIGQALASAGLPALPITIAIGALVGTSSGLVMLGGSTAALARWRFGDPWPGRDDVQAAAPEEAPAGG